MLHHTRQDLVFAWRSLSRNPLFSATAILTLALGVGATTSMFSVVNGVLLKPLPYRDGHRLVRMFTEPLDNPGLYYVMSKPDLLGASNLPAFEAMTGYRSGADVLTGHGDASLIQMAEVTSGILEVFGLEPFMGRDLRLEESEPGARNVVVVGHGFWTGVLGGEPNVLGQTLELEGQAFEIVGIAPPGFEFPGGTQFWRPFLMNPATCGRSCHSYNALARLASGATLEQAREQADAMAVRLAEAYPDTNLEKRFHLESLQEYTVGGVRAELWILLAAVGLVLLVACANVANLLLARGQGRITEVGIRGALGAGRGRLLAQILTESLVLALLGGALGLGMAFLGVAVLKNHAPPGIPRMPEVAVDPGVLLFTLALTLCIAVAFGLSPALGLARSSPAAALRRSGRGTGAPSQRARSVLLASEMAFSVVLLVGAGLLLRTLARIRAVDPGYRTEDILQFRLDLPPARYSGKEQVVQFFSELEERIQALPQVVSVGSAFRMPLLGAGSNGSVFLEGHEVEPGRRLPHTYPRPMTPGYLDVMDIPVLRGRGLSPSDFGDAEPAALVNETFVRENFPGEEPLGKRFHVGVTYGLGSPVWTIVGVVPDLNSISLTGRPPSEIFLPLRHLATRSMTVAVRFSPGASSLLPAIRAEVHAMDPSLPLRSVSTLEQAVAFQMAGTRFYLALLAIFAGLAVTLAAVGLYGVVSYLVSRRRREVGIRMALGADGQEILRLFLRQAALPTLAGIGAGVALALAGASVLEAFLFQVNPRDPQVLGVVVGVLLTVALGATAVPAQSAARIAPTEAMKAD